MFAEWWTRAWVGPTPLCTEPNFLGLTYKLLYFYISSIKTFTQVIIPYNGLAPVAGRVRKTGAQFGPRPTWSNRSRPWHKGLGTKKYTRSFSREYLNVALHQVLLRPLKRDKFSQSNSNSNSIIPYPLFIFFLIRLLFIIKERV